MNMKTNNAAGKNEAELKPEKMSGKTAKTTNNQSDKNNRTNTGKDSSNKGKGPKGENL